MDMAASGRIEVAHGERRAVFVHSAEGWTPDWFYLDDRPMLRFKDHEWLSIGHLGPMHATRAESLPDGGETFYGQCTYGSTPVAWSVTIHPDALGDGFIIECGFTPEADIELLEAYSSFETPYEYDGREMVTTLIGMNPVTRWRGAACLTPPIWKNPAWSYSRSQAARNTAPCSAPYLAQSIVEAEGIADRHIAIIGDWQVCRARDLYATPTRDTAHSPGGGFSHRDDLRGYKYNVGALNWSSTIVKDPNVLYAGGEAHRQRVIVTYADALPDGTIDGLCYQAWERACRLHLPADGTIDAWRRATARGTSWQAATRWLRDRVCADMETPGFFHPEHGMAVYAEGTRPKGCNHYGIYPWAQWSGPLHYRAAMTDDAPLHDACDRMDQRLAQIRPERYFQGIIGSICALPTLHWLHAAGASGVLGDTCAAIMAAALQRSVAENGQTRPQDGGAQSGLAEGLLLGAAIFDSSPMRAQALLLLSEINAKLDENFWEFNAGRSGDLTHGGQIRSFGHGHAIMANLLAYRQTGESAYRTAALRFARLLLSINYATHNGSHDPDFDWRGWCNGSNSGRDQIAEFPPLETQNALLCVLAAMETLDVPDGGYDMLWYVARTGLAQFPAARSLKRVYDEAMGVRYISRETIASERDFYDALPYLAYENPHDQTLLAPYQGTDCLIGEYAYGGGLVRAADERLGVLLPRVAWMDLDERETRVVHLWNPTEATLASAITAHWGDGRHTTRAVTVPPRTITRCRLTRDERE